MAAAGWRRKAAHQAVAAVNFASQGDLQQWHRAAISCYTNESMGVLISIAGLCTLHYQSVTLMAAPWCISVLCIPAGASCSAYSGTRAGQGGCYRAAHATVARSGEGAAQQHERHSARHWPQVWIVVLKWYMVPEHTCCPVLPSTKI
jgi:hypothetical protein